MSEIVLKGCSRLHARITDQQCERNRNGYRAKGINYPGLDACARCPGLGHIEQVVQQEVTVAVHAEAKAKKKPVCIEEGCDKGIVKNKRCYKHNKRFEAAQAAQAERQSIDETTPAELDKASSIVLAAKPVKRLDLLLAPPPPPTPATLGVFVPLDPGELEELAAREVTPEDIAELVRMLLANQLQRREGGALDAA